MMKFRLRLEGVNLAHFVLDTKDLSTVRGGSLALLGATVGWNTGGVKGQWEAQLGLRPVTTGASAGLYEFEAEDGDAALEIRDRVVTLLNADDVLRHATVVVDVLPSGETFRVDWARLLTLNRYRQMRSPTVAVPTAVPSARDACDFDGLRPASSRTQRGPDTHYVSRSVKDRRDFGRDQKQRFYEEEIRKADAGYELPFGFTQDLEGLAGPPTSGWSQDRGGWSPGNLGSKVAVLYLDGNSLGELQRNHFSAEPEHQRSFDTYLKKLRRGLLKAIVEAFVTGARSPTPWRWANDRSHEDDRHWRLRLETLLWGGDEILWVVPAWLGWWLLDEFERRSETWSIQDADGGTHPIFHAAGLVFCHHSAPIHRVQVLARRLAEAAKKVDRRRSLFAYQVLESFDHVGTDFEDFRSRRSPTGRAQDLVLAGACAAEVATELPKVKSRLPRNKLHAVARGILGQPDRTIVSGGTPPARRIVHRSWRDEAQAAAGGLGGDAEKSLARLKEVLGAGNEAIAWIHMAELWDYVGEEGGHD